MPSPKGTKFRRKKIVKKSGTADKTQYLQCEKPPGGKMKCHVKKRKKPLKSNRR